MPATTADVAIVGGGLVGLATALALTEAHPNLRLTILEKEAQPGRHQSGRNSGVIHSGVYYRPGSLKARLCVEGARRMVAFCHAHGVRHEVCGKVIVATLERELPALEELHRRAAANAVPGVTRIDAQALREIEPGVRGLAALHVASTGIADYPGVVAALARVLTARGAQIRLGAELVGARPEGSGLRLRTAAGDLVAGVLVNCAGLYSDIVAGRCGIRPPVRIVPFRGEYYMVRPERRGLVRGLVYPVPDPRYPFLGVHFTRTVNGDVEAGPNAVLALAREGYSWGRVNAGELASTLGYAGFRRMAARHWRMAAYEYYRSLHKRAFVAALRRLVPAVRGEDLVPGGAGVRAQAVAPDGALVDDFRIVRDGRAIHVLNAPSPAATASLAIGSYIAELVGEHSLAAVAAPPDA